MGFLAVGVLWALWWSVFYGLSGGRCSVGYLGVGVLLAIWGGAECWCSMDYLWWSAFCRLSRGSVFCGLSGGSVFCGLSGEGGVLVFYGLFRVVGVL